MQTRWQKAGEYQLKAFDQWTRTWYSLNQLDNLSWDLTIIVDGCDDILHRNFKTLAAAKMWVTKNFS